MAIKYTPDLLINGTASASSEEVGYEAAKACDNNTATAWSSGDVAYPHWWNYYFGNGKRIIKLTIMPRLVTGVDYGLKNFTLQGSNDNVNWTTVYTGLAANNGDIQVFTFTNTNFYKYYRINATDGYNLTYKYTYIKEFEMMAEVNINFLPFI